MAIAFDSTKDAINRAKHGLPLSRAEELDVRVLVPSGRDSYGGQRTRAYGLLDGLFHCLVFTVRDGEARAISLRRAKRREYNRYVPD